jgi:putative acetyltransferase
MLTELRTTSENADFQKLTALFDHYLIDIDGDEKDFFAHYNQIYLDHVIVCFENDIAIGCGAFKQHENKTIEIKRMFVDPNHRKKGAANIILNALENWAIEIGNNNFILETSVKLEAAIALYFKAGYVPTNNYGQYVGVASSYCMKKII